MDRPKRHLLVIVYYWPPSGGSGVQRWLKMVKYLSKMGYRITVCLPANPEYPVLDEAHAAEVPDDVQELRVDFWEPYDLYRKVTGKKKDQKLMASFGTEEGEKHGLMHNLAVWLRGNFFIPDARKSWIKPAIKACVKRHGEDPFDAIISSGPPHSAHLIGLGVKKRTGLPWLSDFRDPWTNIDFYKDLKLTSWADKKHHRLEKKVATTADELVVVTDQMREEFEPLRGSDVRVVMNGFDVEAQNPTPQTIPEKLTFLHAGTLGENRHPGPLFEVIAEELEKIPDLKDKVVVSLIGRVDASISRDLKKHLPENHELIPYVAHSDLMSKLWEAGVLLLVLNDAPNAKGILTGKLFEYLAAKRPILCVGASDGDAAKVIENTRAGWTVERQKEQQRQVVSEIFKAYQGGTLKVDNDVSGFSRKGQAEQISQLVESMLESK